MFKKTELNEGMTVRSADGDKLGKIVAINDRGIQIEKGIFFPKEYTASFDQIDQISNGDLYLKWGTNLIEQQYDSFYGAGSYLKETEDGSRWTDYNKNTEESIPLREEELSVNRKGMEETGRVRIFKTVRTEDQHFTVPVTKEEVHIERVPASDRTTGLNDTNLDFKEDEVTIPVREEKVEVTKRPTVREEIRVSKSSKQVDQEVGGTVRKEEARIEKENYVDRNRTDHDLHP